MKAFICDRYGTPNVLKLSTVKDLTAKDNEVLIRVYATSVTAADFRLRGLNVPWGFALLVRLALGFSKPKKPILGMIYSGIVEKTGKSVKKFKVGDRVFGSSENEFGAYAEYICVAESSVLTRMSSNMDFDQAAALPFGGLTALDFLGAKGGIKSGQKVLIYGASGSVGVAAVQLAKYFGAHVTAVSSSANMSLLASLAADRLIDYTKTNVVAAGDSYDIILDCVGKSAWSDFFKVLVPNGRLLILVAGLPDYIRVVWHNLYSRKKVIGGIAAAKVENLEILRDLFEQGKIVAVIDRVYPFDQLPDAHAYAEKGHKKGNVVIQLTTTS